MREARNQRTRDRHKTNRREYQRAWVAANREKRREHSRNWDRKNRARRPAEALARIAATTAKIKDPWAIKTIWRK